MEIRSIVEEFQMQAFGGLTAAWELLVRLPEPWNYLLSFNIYFNKSIKVTQSPIVPRVRGGDPSGVAPEKVEGFFSAPGHPWKLFS